ncbi:hypothetical protein [Pseudorhizobium flavum]|jgi:hypothetical protein|uniref:hypothetical protein n=1 Tax=Pseudorhizobium flavum TaxID=1335061 RepID=UPI00376FCA62
MLLAFFVNVDNHLLRNDVLPSGFLSCKPPHGALAKDNPKKGQDMKTSLTTGFVAALIASSAIAGSALAQSTQYEPYAESPPSLDDTQVDTMSTGSINGDRNWMIRDRNMANTDIDGTQDRGDYYEGALRPTN